jgi:hypothetical protein
MRHSDLMAAKLFVMEEPLLPGQIMRCREPPSLPGAASLVWDLIASTSEPLIAVGCSERSLLSRGVHVTAGWDDTDFILTATDRIADIVESGIDNGASACLDGGVQWLTPLQQDDFALSPDDGISRGPGDAPEALEPVCARLGYLVEEWCELVRGDSLFFDMELDVLLERLGRLPYGLNARALWVGALLNAQPELVPAPPAMKIKGAILTARTTAQRLQVVEYALCDSIQRMRGVPRPEHQ